MRRIALWSLLALTACEERDTKAPPPPVVDPIATPTPLTRVSVTGTAEFNAKIQLAGGAADVDTVADAYTARWRVEVMLKADAENNLTVTATDAAGNVSEATTVKVLQSPSKPASITLALGSPTAKAGEPVTLLPRVLDQYGNVMPDAPVTFEVTPALATTFSIPGVMPAVTKGQGVLAAGKQFVAYDLSSVRGARYEFQLKASTGTVSDTQVLVVHPASALSFSRLNFLPSGTTATVRAGADVEYEYEVTDLYGNVTTGPVSAYTNAPGALVVDDGVTGKGKLTRLVTAGAWTASFYIAGVGQKGAMNLNVGVAPGATVEVSASTSLTGVRSRVQVFARVRDAFGNQIACDSGAPGNLTDMVFAATGTLASSPGPAPTSAGCFNGAFTASFVFTEENTWAISATWSTGANAVTSSVFVTTLAFDNTPPTVTIKNVVVIANSGVAATPCGTDGGCDLAFGDTVTFDVEATDNLALAQVGYGIFFENRGQGSTRIVYVPANQATWTSSFRFNVPNTVEVAPLVATAMDRAGNFQNSLPLTIRVNSGMPLGGRTMTVVASAGRVDQPVDVAATANGDIYVLNGGNNNGNREVLRISSGSTTPVAIPNTAGAGGLGSSLVIATRGAQERLFFTDTQNTGDFIQVDLNGGNRQTLTVSPANSFTGIGVLPALAARGWLDFAATTDGAQVQLQLAGNPTELYEVDTNASCSAVAGKVCVTSATGGAAIATAVAASLGTSRLVTATASGTRVALTAAQPGESNGASISILAGTIARSMPALVDGHDQDFYLGNDSDASIRRQLASGAAHGTFGALAPQLGLVVRDVWAQAPSNANFLDVMGYVVERGSNNLLAFNYTTSVVTPGTLVGANAPAVAFTVNATTVGGAQPFTNLSDVVLLPSGCVAVADSGNVYTVDVRAAKTFTGIAVERIARNLATPWGLGTVANGQASVNNSADLLIAATNANAVLRLAPTTDTTDCF